MDPRSVHIIKSTGDLVSFSTEKLKTSLKRSGADEATINAVAEEVVGHLHEGMTTKEIYRLAYKLLKRKYRTAASKYTLKRAIMELGPSGFPFEKLVGEIFKSKGYDVKLNRIISGRCVSHEVDIFAENEDSVLIMECKYHNSQATPCDVKIPLYVNSRYLDIKSAHGDKGKAYSGWIVTNTKFTTDAVQYASCIGINLLSWDYPKNESLKELVDKLKIYPITCLTTISKKEKQLLLEQGIVLCKDLVARSTVLAGIMVSEARIGNIVNEALGLISN